MPVPRAVPGTSVGNYLGVSSRGSNSSSHPHAWTSPAVNMQLLPLGAVVQEGNKAQRPRGASSRAGSGFWAGSAARSRDWKHPQHPLTILRAWSHDGHYLLLCSWSSSVRGGWILPGWKRGSPGVAPSMGMHQPQACHGERSGLPEHPPWPASSLSISLGQHHSYSALYSVIGCRKTFEACCPPVSACCLSSLPFRRAESALLAHNGVLMP